MMRFAYADPPYPGQARRWYGERPDYGGEVDHAELLGRLCRDYPDGWALSTSAAALREVLILCPADARVVIWHVLDRVSRGNGRWLLNWEPVIISGGRQGYGEGEIVSSVLAAGSLAGGCASRAGKVITGQKPPSFCRWLFKLLGARPGDELDDLFPGSGVVGERWRDYLAQPMLPEPQTARWAKDRRNVARQVSRSCDPLWD